MSLKGFHIVFITVSTLLCVVMAWWSLSNREVGGATALIGPFAFVCGIALVIYGVWFVRKLRNLEDENPAARSPFEVIPGGDRPGTG